MTHDLLTPAERLQGLRNRPYIMGPAVRAYFFWRRRPALREPETLSLREARLFGLGVLLLALGSAGLAWLFALLGWMR